MARIRNHSGRLHRCTWGAVRRRVHPPGHSLGRISQVVVPGQVSHIRSHGHSARDGHCKLRKRVPEGHVGRTHSVSLFRMPPGRHVGHLHAQVIACCGSPAVGVRFQNDHHNIHIWNQGARRHLYSRNGHWRVSWSRRRNRHARARHIEPLLATVPRLVSRHHDVHHARTLCDDGRCVCACGRHTHDGFSGGDHVRGDRRPQLYSSHYDRRHDKQMGRRCLWSRQFGRPLHIAERPSVPRQQGGVCARNNRRQCNGCDGRSASLCAARPQPYCPEPGAHADHSAVQGLPGRRQCAVDACAGLRQPQ
eukprot:Opistho-2@49443